MSDKNRYTKNNNDASIPQLASTNYSYVLKNKALVALPFEKFEGSDH